ncbi:glycosyltransferase family 4 protein [Nocardioides sp. Kera G14]|uniref:glycosyltransferase family 4 protein n=1 Tax=Nocardioides sp. Kera G14 TaxID=2884264 RepID=UPI001D122E05|nr:glycosyltransferase family 4 protein [Nocardioides sp. Kera G14]UDY23603.1 glycosyltransferase family 4 protein [Nocardioides sp. Kera G14]
MRILVHDHSGHPFQAELSRELARRGHSVTHSYVAGYVCGKGRLKAQPDESITFEAIGSDKPIQNLKIVERLGREIRRGVELIQHVRRVDADIVMVSNVQIPTLVIFAFAMAVMRRPWVLWHQDVYAVALRSFVGTKLSPVFRLAAVVFEVAERWCSCRAAAIVAISPAFVPVHERWGTAGKTSVIPNWAPVDEIVPVERDNAWAKEHSLDGTKTLLYAGTLGLKHDHALLTELAKAVHDLGEPVRLVVVNEGHAVPAIEASAERLDVPLTRLPFQPYEQLPQVLGSGDILVVVLDREAGAFSVPSKTLSYLCAGRPVLGIMPPENLASELISRTGGGVVAPGPDALHEAAEWCVAMLRDADARAEVGRASRQLAESEFALSGCANRFETLLHEAAGIPQPTAIRVPKPRRGWRTGRQRTRQAKTSAA